MAKTNTLIPTHQTLPPRSREEMAALLKVMLASAIDLYSHAKQAHWNVRGAEFMAIHELFDKVAAEAEAHADELAERAGQLGSEVEGTIRRVSKDTALPEYPLGIAESADHVEQLASSLALFSKQVRQGIKKADEAEDPVTTDILTTICRSVDKTLWFVESHGALGGKRGAISVKRAS